MAQKKRPDGRYSKSVYLGIVDGKRKYKCFYGETLKEVDKKVREFKTKREKGLDGSLLTFADAVSLLLDSKRNISPDALKTLEFRLNPFVSAFGNEIILNIRKREIEPILSDLALYNPTTGKPSAQRTVSRYLSACSAVFENAIENRLIEFNPCKYCEVPKGLLKNERRALTAEEIKRIEDTPHRCQLICMLLIYSGLRKGEATALKWDDVNLTEKTITVNKSYDFKNYRVKTPKTAAGVRVVSIPQKLVDYLKKQKRTSPYVLHTLDNRMLTYSAWQSIWRSYLLELDLKYGAGEKLNKFSPHGHIMTIEPFTPHECRHTFCTLMYLAGVDILTAQQQMGHSDVKTTLSIYSHLDSQYKKKNVSKLDLYLSNNA